MNGIPRDFWVGSGRAGFASDIIDDSPDPMRPVPRIRARVEVNFGERLLILHGDIGTKPPQSSRVQPVSASRTETESETLKVAPRPMPLLYASTSPPCSSTRCRTMASPSPKPATDLAESVGLYLDQAFSQRTDRGVGATEGTQFLHDVIHVAFHCALADTQCIGNFFVGVPYCHVGKKTED